VPPAVRSRERRRPIMSSQSEVVRFFLIKTSIGRLCRTSAVAGSKLLEKTEAVVNSACRNCAPPIATRKLSRNQPLGLTCTINSAVNSPGSRGPDTSKSWASLMTQRGGNSIGTVWRWMQNRSKSAHTLQ
jgi:hypothetical protein